MFLFGYKAIKGFQTGLPNNRKISIDIIWTKKIETAGFSRVYFDADQI